MENYIQVHNNNSYGREKVIYPSMTKIVNQFNHLYNLFNFSVELVPAGYYSPDNGIYGYQGFRPTLSPAARRDYFPESIETLKCSMILNCIDGLEDLASQIKITIGGRNTLKPLTIVNNYGQTAYYIYKKPLEKILEYARLINNQFTEDQLLKSDICQYDFSYGFKYNKTCCYVSVEDLHLPNELLKIKYMDNNSVKNYTVTLEIIGTNIEPNHDIIIKLLKTAEQYL